MSPLRKVAMPAPLIRFWVGVLVLTGLSAAYTIVMTRIHHSPHPWGVPLFWGEDAGWDFNIFRDRFLLFRTDGFWMKPGAPLTYPAALGVALGLLYKLAHPLQAYFLVCLAGAMAWAFWLIRGLARRGVAWGPATIFVLTVVATSWPLWVLFNTGNLEGLVVIVGSAGLLAFVRRRWWLAAGLFGVAGAMKIFPLLLLGLLLSRRRYREFAGGIVTAIAVTLISLAVLGPSIRIAQSMINRGLRVVTVEDALAVASGGPDTNHSLYVAVRYAVLVAHHRHPRGQSANPMVDAAMLRPVFDGYIVCVALLGIASYVVRIRHLPMLNQILILSCCAVTLPPLSRDYTLLHLLVPFGLLCFYVADRAVLEPAALREGDFAVRLAACFGCFAIVFNAATGFDFGRALTSPIRGLTLLALILIALTVRFHWPYLDEPGGAAKV